MELVSAGQSLCPQRLKRRGSHRDRGYALAVQTSEQLGEGLIQATQLGESQQSKLSPSHAFKCGETCAHTHGPGDSPIQTLASRYQMGLA
jgi:hypothetical protein